MAAEKIKGLSGKTAVVVGASSGWGRGIALALAAQGTKIIVGGTNPEAVAGVVDEVRTIGAQVAGCAVGVHTAAGAQQLTSFALDECGTIDILVNSTGGKVTGTILELEAEDFDTSVDIQLKAPFLMTHLVAQHMVSTKTRGRIINLAGGAAVRPLYGESLHCATKGGLLAATWTWAKELEPYGITVNAIRGGVRTKGTGPLIQTIRGQLAERGLPDTLTDRELGFFESEEAAPLAVWFASDNSADVTGQFVGIDGGKITIWGLANTGHVLQADEGWTTESLDSQVRPLLEHETNKARGESQVIEALNHIGAKTGS